MMTEPPQYQTSENHKKLKSSFKRNMKRRDGKLVLHGGVEILKILWQSAMH